MADFINTIDVIGDDVLARSIVDGSVVEFCDYAVTSIGEYAFHSCSKLTTADFPSVTSIGNSAFYGCASLTTADFPVVTSIGSSAFYTSTALTTVAFPAATSIGSYAFQSCSALTTADFPVATSIGDNVFNSCTALATVNIPVVTNINRSAFSGCSKLTTADFSAVRNIDQSTFLACSKLTTLILRDTAKIATLSNVNAFTSTPIKSGTGYIYVPRDLVESYKSATNWSTYANQFRALEDYTVDGTTTGEVDTTRCRVRFFDEDGTFLCYIMVPTGGTAVYPGEEPTKEGEWAFNGWGHDLTNVTADMDCYAQFRSTALLSRQLVHGTLAGDYVNDRVTSVGKYVFSYCNALTSISLPAVTDIADCAFVWNKSLTRADLYYVGSIGSSAFQCPALSTVILRGNTMVSIDSDNVFSNTPIKKGGGYIYVPSTLMNSYKRDFYWKEYANQFRAIEDYPDICGGEV